MRDQVREVDGEKDIVGDTGERRKFCVKFETSRERRERQREREREKEKEKQREREESREIERERERKVGSLKRRVRRHLGR